MQQITGVSLLLPLLLFSFMSAMEENKGLVSNEKGKEHVALDQRSPLMSIPARVRLDYIQQALHDNEQLTGGHMHNPEQKLLCAAFQGNEKAVRLLTRQNVAVNCQNQEGKTALMFASQQGYTAIVKMLLKQGAEVDQEDVKGQTALFGTTVEIVPLLLSYGATIDHPNKKGNTPLIVACKEDNEELARALLQHGADINKYNLKGRPAIFAAKLPALIALLKQQGANIDQQDPEGNAAIHYAINKEKYEQMKSLIEEGARVFIKNKAGQSPYMRARLIKDEKKMDIFLERLKKRETDIIKKVPPYPLIVVVIGSFSSFATAALTFPSPISQVALGFSFGSMIIGPCAVAGMEWRITKNF